MTLQTSKSIYLFCIHLFVSCFDFFWNGEGEGSKVHRPQCKLFGPIRDNDRDGTAVAGLGPGRNRDRTGTRPGPGLGQDRDGQDWAGLGMGLGRTGTGTGPGPGLGCDHEDRAGPGLGPGRERTGTGPGPGPGPGRGWDRAGTGTGTVTGPGPEQPGPGPSRAPIYGQILRPIWKPIFSLWAARLHKKIYIGAGGPLTPQKNKHFHAFWTLVK